MEDDHAGLVERHGRWVLPLDEGRITQLRLDFAFSIMIDAWIDIRIECSFSLVHQGLARTFDPGITVELAPLLALRGAVVVSAEVVKDGHLRLEFGNGDLLLVAPSDCYEAFTVSGSRPPIHIERRFNLTALPGGGLLVV